MTFTVTDIEVDGECTSGFSPTVPGRLSIMWPKAGGFVSA
jgi:hypothetical protein